MSREGNPPIPEQHSTAAIPCIAVVQGLKIRAPASAGERYSVRAQWTEWVATSTDASRAAGEPEQCRSTSFCWLLFPLIYGLISVSSSVFFASCGRWGRRQLRSSINLTNWLDGWLVLRLVRLAVPLRDRCARRPSDASVRRKPAAPALAARRSLGIPCIAMIAAAPWGSWGWSSFQPITFDGPDKTLALLRLPNVLALTALAISSSIFRVLVERPALHLLVVRGGNPLQVFTLGTRLARKRHLTT